MYLMISWPIRSQSQPLPPLSRVMSWDYLGSAIFQHGYPKNTYSSAQNPDLLPCDSLAPEQTFEKHILVVYELCNSASVGSTIQHCLFFNVCITGSESLNKPIPGPRMPDGTKGFTMGRGRPLPLQKSEMAEEQNYPKMPVKNLTEDPCPEKPGKI